MALEQIHPLGDINVIEIHPVGHYTNTNVNVTVAREEECFSVFLKNRLHDDREGVWNDETISNPEVLDCDGLTPRPDIYHYNMSLQACTK